MKRAIVAVIVIALALICIDASMDPARAEDAQVWAYPMKPLAFTPEVIVYTYCNHGTRLYVASTWGYQKAAGGIAAVKDDCRE